MERFRNISHFHCSTIRISTTTMKRSPQQFKTHFEDLSAETIYELFEYLDIFDIYDTFFNLNIRFRQLLTHSDLPIKLQISSISKSDLEYYHTNVITAYLHRITSLCITNGLSYDLPISSHYLLTGLIRLETLILENLPSKYLDQVFRDVSTLPNLSNLAILCPDHVRDTNQHLLQIFRLRALKYCKIFLTSYTRSSILPFATNEHSPIEHLVIKHPFCMQNIDRLLSYLPQLHRLSLEHFSHEDLFTLSQPIRTSCVRHVSFKLDRFNFDRFEILIQNFFPRIEVLRLSVYGEEEYLHPNRWEDLITSSMPCLRIFDIDIRSYLRGPSISRLDQFHSSFWLDRQWFLFHEGYRGKDWYSTRLYSIDPFRQKEYRFQWSKDLYIGPNYNDINFQFVRHVLLIGQRSVGRCKHKFFNATELTLDRITSRNFKLDVTALHKILSLEKLTKLEITSPEYSFQQLMEFLSLSHNLHTLKIRRLRRYDETDFTTFPNSDLFQFVSNVNMIRTLTITDLTEVKEVRLLFSLFPRLQYFTIDKQQRHAVAIIRFLASKLIDTAQHLILLSIRVGNGRCLDSLKRFIETRECLQNCFLKIEKCQVHLWR